MSRNPSIAENLYSPQAKHLINAHPHLDGRCEGGRATGLLIVPHQSLKGSMVHPLASKQRVEQTAPSPAPFPDLPCARVRPVAERFTLARIGKPIAVATGEDCPTIENRHTPPAPSHRTAKPDPLSPVVARRPLQHDGIFLIGPFSTALAGAVIENYPVRFGTDVDISHWLTVSRPLPTE
jgi:hypothetical protein